MASTSLSCSTCLSKLFLETIHNTQSFHLSPPSIYSSTTLGNRNKEGFTQIRRKTKKKFQQKIKHDLIVRKATPESAAGDILSSLPIPSALSDNPWLTGIAGLLVVVPFVIQKLLTLTKEVDIAAETVEKIAETVGKVAEEVDKAAEDIIESLPEGDLKKVVSLVEDLAEETVKDAHKVEHLMDKIEELDDKVDAMLKQQSKDINEKA